MIVLGWVLFVLCQLAMLAAQLVGLVLLIPFCLAQAWTPAVYPSVKLGHGPVDRWSWGPLNYIYGNPEDGVSGQQAVLIGGAPFAPGVWGPWRAYRWSAWRNSSDNLKYVFQWQGGPFFKWNNGKYHFQAGWNEKGLPGLSGGRM